ncbi:MAG: peptidylprolyl isomerase [Pseudolabrys sp.]|nr:peptidylprolyl isomerase [Pseudolabrys sp.]
MTKRLAAILCLAVLAMSLGGCSKCGPFWEQGPRSCHSDRTR